MNSSDNNVWTAGESSPRIKQLARISEIGSAFLLGIAALASSWAGYQATRWSGVQASNYVEANALRIESSRLSTTGHQLQAVDLAMFVSWLNSYAEGDVRKQEFLTNNFRPEFLPFFQKWLATKPAKTPVGYNNPFNQPGYTSSLELESLKLEQAAKQHYNEGGAANEQGDKYVFVSVILSSVLFFAGIVPQFKVIQLRIGVLIIAALLCAFALYKLAIYPVR